MPHRIDDDVGVGFMTGKENGVDKRWENLRGCNEDYSGGRDGKSKVPKMVKEMSTRVEKQRNQGFVLPSVFYVMICLRRFTFFSTMSKTVTSMFFSEA